MRLRVYFRPFGINRLRTLLRYFAFFCTHKKCNSFLFKRFRTLCQKTGGGASPTRQTSTWSLNVYGDLDYNKLSGSISTSTAVSGISFESQYTIAPLSSFVSTERFGDFSRNWNRCSFFNRASGAVAGPRIRTSFPSCGEKYSESCSDHLLAFYRLAASHA